MTCKNCLPFSWPKRFEIPAAKYLIVLDRHFTLVADGPDRANLSSLVGGNHLAVTTDVMRL
jgi:hypothetical protein